MSALFPAPLSALALQQTGLRPVWPNIGRHASARVRLFLVRSMRSRWFRGRQTVFIQLFETLEGSLSRALEIHVVTDVPGGAERPADGEGRVECRCDAPAFEQDVGWADDAEDPERD